MSVEHGLLQRGQLSFRPRSLGSVGGKMSTAISQVLVPLEPYFYARSIVRIALKRLTKKCSSSNEFNRDIVILILPPQALVNQIAGFQSTMF